MGTVRALLRHTQKGICRGGRGRAMCPRSLTQATTGRGRHQDKGLTAAVSICPLVPEHLRSLSCP